MFDAPGPQPAMKFAEQFQERIHLLITDVIMPDLSGRQLAQRLTASRPEMRVLYMSGYTDNAIIHHGVLEGGVEFIQKPFSFDAMLHKVNEVLNKE